MRMRMLLHRFLPRSPLVTLPCRSLCVGKMLLLLRPWRGVNTRYMRRRTGLRKETRVGLVSLVW